MQVARSIRDIRSALAERPAAATVVFVPTMGALHKGHARLLARARELGDVVVLSIFVNPLQFGPSEDYAAYPRHEERDLEFAADLTDVAFVPTPEEMFDPEPVVTVRVAQLGSVLEGAARPGHFDGVGTVVAKLFNVVQPDIAVFGQKDAQQIAVIAKLIQDLAFPVALVTEPTVREPDGLAVSSRNVYLSPSERSRATALWSALGAGRTAWEAGAPVKRIEEVTWNEMDVEGVRPEYARVVHPETFLAPGPDDPALLVVAARVGAARLIDNLPLRERVEAGSTEGPGRRTV